MHEPMMLTNKRLRKKIRTAVLGLVAFGALIWGAVDIVGVPAANMAHLLWQITAGVAVLIAASAAPAYIMYRRRQRRRDQI